MLFLTYNFDWIKKIWISIFSEYLKIIHKINNTINNKLKIKFINMENKKVRDILLEKDEEH